MDTQHHAEERSVGQAARIEGVSTAADPLAHFWSVTLPRRLDPWAPHLADAFADGSWTAAWRGVAGYTPVVALALGLLILRILPATRSIEVYTESLTFMALVITAAILSGAAGAMLLLGFIVVDLLGAGSGHFRGAFQSLPLVVRWILLYGSLLVSYLLLGLLAIRMPLLARRMVEEINVDRLVYPAARPVVRAALFGLSCGLLVWVWSKAMVFLIRPAFTWLLVSPTTRAIQPVQVNWEWLVGVAVLAAGVRILLEDRVAARSARAGLVRDLQRQRAYDALSLRERPRSIVVQVLPMVGVITLLLAGAYRGWLDALLVAVVVTAVALWQRGVGRLPGLWAAAVLRVPLLVRFLAALLAGYWLASMMVQRFWGTSRPILYGALLTLAVFLLLFPRSARSTTSASEGREVA